MGRGYSGNHPRYSGERYDAKQAYNKDLTASARLHYLENDRHDHDSPHHMSVNERLNDSFGMGQNTGFSASPMNKHCKSHSPVNNRADKIRERAGKISSETQGQGGYDYENPKVQKLLSKARKVDERSGMKSRDERSGELRGREMDDMMDNRPDSPFNACAKDEGGSGCIQEMGGAWRVISNKTDKPWPAKYASKSKAEAALRGYHAG
jgi:hypothetical protein